MTKNSFKSIKVLQKKTSQNLIQKLIKFSFSTAMNLLKKFNLIFSNFVQSIKLNWDYRKVFMVENKLLRKFNNTPIADSYLEFCTRQNRPKKQITLNYKWIDWNLRTDSDYVIFDILEGQTICYFGDFLIFSIHFNLSWFLYTKNVYACKYMHFGCIFCYFLVSIIVWHLLEIVIYLIKKSKKHR